MGGGGEGLNVFHTDIFKYKKKKNLSDHFHLSLVLSLPLSFSVIANIFHILSHLR